MIKLKKTLIIFTCISLLVVCCDIGDQPGYEHQDQLLWSNDSIIIKVAGKQDRVIYLLPSPGEILEYIEHYHIEYNPFLASPAENHKKYLSEKAAALNMGIYIADLSYTAIFEKNNESLGYLEALENLMKQLRIAHALNDDILGKIKDRYNVLDSLPEISGDVFDDVVDYLKSRRMHDVLSLISIGGYIESLYITVDIIKQHQSNDTLMAHLMDQKYIFENLYGLSSPHIKGKRYLDILNHMNTLKEIFTNFKEDYTLVDIKEDEQEDNSYKNIELISSSEVNIKEFDFNALEREINRIRNSIINE